MLSVEVFKTFKILAGRPTLIGTYVFQIIHLSRYQNTEQFINLNVWNSTQQI